MKRLTSILCALMVLLGANAAPSLSPKVAVLPAVKTLNGQNITFDKQQIHAYQGAAKAPKAKLDSDWEAIGNAIVTEQFGSIFSWPEETYATASYKSKTTEGLFAIDITDSYGGTAYGGEDLLVIHAEDPELVYILQTNLQSTNETYGILSVASTAGRYMGSYDMSVIISSLGTGDDVWGKKNKNVISFTKDAMKCNLSAYNGGTWFLGAPLTVVLPDLAAPTITAVNNSSIGGTKAIVEVVADDDADVVDSLTFTVKNGETVILENAKTTDGKLTITGLTISTTYNLTITATDRSGKSSEPFAFTFTTGATDDSQAPVLTKAELKQVSDKWATIEVAATDNVTDAADIVYVVTFADATKVNLKAEEGLIKLTGLTPETSYSLTVAAKDEADNSSAPSQAINFKTLEIIPIVMNIDWIQAQYYSNYSSAGAYNFEIAYWEGDDNYVVFDTYTKKNNAISGTWSTADGTIEAEFSSIMYNGASVKVVSATQTLVFVSLNETNNQATYNASFEAMGADGNLYKGAFTTEVMTYAKSGSSSSYVSMAGELPDTKAPTLSSASATVGEDLTSATITVRATDDQTATSAIKVELQQEDGTKVADFTYRSSQFSASVTGLTKDTEYTYYIAAEDETGNKTAAADRLLVTFKTADNEAPTFSATGTSVRSKTATSAVIRAAARDNITAVGELTVYAASDEEGNNKLVDMPMTQKASALAYYQGEITGLTPATEYTIYVIALDKAGNKASTSLTFTTEAATNEAPVIGTIVATPSENGASVTIQVTDDNTAADELDVVIQDDNQQEIATATYNAQTQLFEATISNLAKDTEYTFTVFAYDEENKYSTKSFTFAAYGTGVNNLVDNSKSIKTIENGLFFIEKSGRTYNAQGAVVR